MKKFQHLTINHEDSRRLVTLLGDMKATQNRVFKLLKTETVNYAKNIFKTPDKVACFKTERKSLFESKVWLYIGEAGLVVANITSESNSRLGVTNYNLILNTFFTEIVRPLVGGFLCVLTGEDVSFNEILPANVYHYLNSWQETCDKSAPIAHPNDYKKWTDFLISYFEQCDGTITPSDLEQWLAEDCHWPQCFSDSIEEMGERFEYSIDLLRAYHEHLDR